MGWTSLHRAPGMSDREFFEQELPTTLTQYGRIVTCSTKNGRGQRVFYAAVRNNADAPYQPGETWALVVLMQRSPNEHWNFSYKDMSDRSGPAEDCAPAYVLDALTPTDDKYATEWRERCRARLASKTDRPRAKRGDTVVFATPQRFRGGDVLTELVFEQYSTFTKPGSGQKYRIPAWRELPHTVKAA